MQSANLKTRFFWASTYRWSRGETRRPVTERNGERRGEGEVHRKLLSPVVFGYSFPNVTASGTSESRQERLQPHQKK